MTSEELNIEFLATKDAAFRYAVSLLHNRSEAEDAVQDLYERFWRRRLLIRRKGFRSLIMTSIRNICLDLLRERERRRSVEVTEQTLIENPSTADDIKTTIHRLIAALPEREREVMHLRDIEQLEFEDIASVVGITESAARMALSRARQKIREELSKIMNYGL